MSQPQHNIKITTPPGAQTTDQLSLVQQISTALTGGEAVYDFFSPNLQALTSLYNTIHTGGDSVWFDGTDEKGNPVQYVHNGNQTLMVGVHSVDHDVVRNGTGSTTTYKQMGALHVQLMTDQGSSVQTMHIINYAGMGLGGLLTAPVLTKYILKPALKTVVRFIRGLISKVFSKPAGSAASPDDAQTQTSSDAEAAAGEAGEEVTTDAIGVVSTVMDVISGVAFVIGIGVFAAGLILYLLEKNMTNHVKFYNLTGIDIDFGICWATGDTGIKLGPAKIGNTTLVKKVGLPWAPKGVTPTGGQDVIYRSDSTFITTSETHGLGYVFNAKENGDFPGFRVMVDIPLVGHNSLYLGFNTNDCKSVWDNQHGSNHNLTDSVKSGKYILQIATNVTHGKSESPDDGTNGYNYQHLIVLTDGSIPL